MDKIIFFILIPLASFCQTLTEGCIKQVNVPAEYIDDVEVIHINAVTYLVPKVEFKEHKVLIKEKAIEHFYEAMPTGELKQCSKIIEAVYETVKIPIVVGYDQVVSIPQQTITKNKKVKIKDGYIANIPCDKIIKN
jgi:aspartate ammonia-lyase